ncbi:DUF6090 family protein [Lutibacter sp. Hel_I_33_5]|uniref:DUF6090 family protein n=1 Tax=Lutibacter sp. Hel_I_33_5 TaxID=1566289 RepID=UPI001647152E
MENKTSKYFKYAIGEIILVVIGILIALQINTWNQQKNNQEILKQFTVEFKEELRLNIRDFKFDLELIKNQKKLKNNLLKNKRLDTIPLDSLEKYVETFYINVAYSPVLLNRFENTQISNYGKYDSIFLDLQEFYGYHWPQFRKELNEHNKAVDKEDQFWRYQQNKYELNFSSDNDTFIKDSIQRKKELIKLIKSPIVRNILKTDLRRKKLFKIRIERKILLGEKIQKQIDEALKD